MKLNLIVAQLNAALAGERHSFNQLVQYLDKTIDDINRQLGSTYPVFSEITTDEYTLFPDSYIRTVVIPGAAWYYFTADEEGISTAEQYAADYERGLFFMLRDHFNNVPAQYQVTDLKALVSAHDVESGESGVSVNGWNILP